jgi:hypothetical protein
MLDDLLVPLYADPSAVCGQHVPHLSPDGRSALSGSPEWEHWTKVPEDLAAAAAKITKALRRVANVMPRHIPHLGLGDSRARRTSFGIRGGSSSR